MTEHRGDDGWQLTGKAIWRTGFAHGARFPSVEMSILLEELDTPAAHSLARDLIAALPAEELAEDWAAQPAAGDEPGTAVVARLLLIALVHLQRGAGLPVFEAGRILALSGCEVRVQATTTAGTQFAIIDLLKWLVQACSLLRSRRPVEDHAARLPQMLEALHSQFGFHYMAHRYVANMLAAGMPFVELPQKILQVGQGRFSRRLANGVTDVCPSLAIVLGRAKHCAAQVLREAGIPVPDHHMVSDAAQARQMAELLGYPVVVKPADRDGGEAVAADLRTPEEVDAAFETALAASKQVLVEKHVQGRDYRLTVFQGEVIWVIERVPGGVTGDGRSDVRELVRQLNLDPRRQAGSHNALKPVEFDDEAREMLERGGLAETSVPAQGQFVKLRRIANVTRGGTPVPITRDIHPDNVRLATRSAAAIGADLAGIDLLIPDIARSWIETGAHICEVNPGPEVGMTTSAHLYGPILGRMVEGNGRIPIALIVGAPPGGEVADNLARALTIPGLAVGYRDQRGVRLADEWLVRGGTLSFSGGQMLLHDQRCGAMVLMINDDDLVATGLPFQRFDILVVAGTALAASDPARARPGGEVAVELVSSLLAACDGTIAILPEVGMSLEHYSGDAQVRYDVTAGDVGAFLNAELQRLAEAHRAVRPFPPLQAIA